MAAGPDPRRGYSDAELDAALDALAEQGRFDEAERLVAAAAPKLQRVLASALAEGGWFGEAHDAQVLKAATTPDEDERLTAVRTLLAEETRMGMMVGVAVGWALHEELASDRSSEGES
jgi:Lon protease-like protein